MPTLKNTDTLSGNLPKILQSGNKVLSRDVRADVGLQTPTAWIFQGHFDIG